jgi:O-acetyl-ADP-ribose deacetylase (regulator of RNase III)
MYEKYKVFCQNKQLTVGKLWLYKPDNDSQWVLNFPTKIHWKYPSKMEYLELGLQKFVDSYKEKGITSISFPLLGTHNGGLDKIEVLNLMHKYLESVIYPLKYMNMILTLLTNYLSNSKRNGILFPQLRKRKQE